MNHRKLRQISLPHTSLFTTDLFKSLANEIGGTGDHFSRVNKEKLAGKIKTDKFTLFVKDKVWRAVSTAVNSVKFPHQAGIITRVKFHVDFRTCWRDFI